jgi:CNT family concentrative nucleoside transporter
MGYNFVSLFGILIILTVAWIFSKDRRNLNWRVIIYGTLIQIFIAVIIFRLPEMSQLFQLFNDGFNRLLGVVNKASIFIFGRISIPPGQTGSCGETSLGPSLAFQGFPTIIFFSAMLTVLYHFGIMQWFIRIFSIFFMRFLRISGAESFCTTSNIFVGVESYFTIRPFMQKMTESELFTILTAGMATIASSVLGLYVILLQKDFPDIAGHLLSASLLSAPAAVVISKIMYPEKGRPLTYGIHPHIEADRKNNVMEAIMDGAMGGVILIVNIVAMLIAFLSLTALINLCLTGFGNQINEMMHLKVNLSLENLLGYLFYPFTIVMGVPLNDAFHISELLGKRLILTEVKAFQDLAILIDNGCLNNQRSIIIASYALCGFSHIASLAIFVGGASSIAPGRKKDLARLGLKALFASNLACLLTGAVAGLFCY